MDLVGLEAGPVLVACNDDGCLHVAEGLDHFEGLSVFGDINLGVADTLRVEGAVGHVALDALRLGVHGHYHGNASYFLPLRRGYLVNESGVFRLRFTTWC